MYSEKERDNISYMTTEFKKVSWEADQDTFRMGLEFNKVNRENRLVSGWATLDNVDTQNDIVTSDASVRAFSRARGNLREMHQKDSAVGKIVSFKEDTFTDPEGNTHRGIFVTAYVSKGAPTTWEKVLDKTLTGFSIGGSINESEDVISKDADGGTVRVIKDYDLTELSLVDNPGNQLANIFQIQKSADGSVTDIKGLATEVDVLNVFYCETHRISQQKKEDSANCPICDSGMTNIGWVENVSDKDARTRELVTKYVTPSETSFTKGGETMPKEKDEEKESVATGNEEGDPREVPTPANPAQGEEVVTEVPGGEDDEEVEKVNEVQDEEDVLLKRIDEIKDVVQSTLETNKEETLAVVEGLKAELETLQKSFDSKASEFEKRFEELDKGLETAKSRLSGFEKSLDAINSSSSVRKSADSDGLVEKNEENPWRGSAFSVDRF